MMLESIELVLARSRSGSSVKQSSTSTRVININSIHSTSQPQSQSSRQDQGHGQHENDEEASISVADRDSGNVDNDVTIINDTTFSFLACLERWWHIVAISAVITGLVVLWPTFGLGMKNKQVQENAYIEECEPGVKRSLRLRHEERKLKQQPSPSPASSCSICGDGMRVGNPDAETDAFSFNGQAGMISCGVLQIMGTVRLIPPPQCEVLPQLISTICECDSTNPTTTTVATPTVFTTTYSLATTEATTPGKSGKSMPSHSLSVSSEAAKSERMLQQQPSCSVCGDGMKVGNPDASVSFPGTAGQIPCGVLQNMGTVGLIPPPQCAVLPQLISTICECESTTPPTTTVPPTTTTKGTKPASGKSGKSMSVSSKAAKAKSEIIKCNTTKSSKVNRK